MDAIAGGGGLITVPALLAAGLPPHFALGTNKAQSVWGSSSALVAFWRAGRVDRRQAVFTFPLGLVGSLVGAALVTMIDRDALRPIVIAMLIGAAVLLVVRKPNREQDAQRPRRWAAALLALSIGAYDGFFGPGTGTFLIVGFVALCGRSLVHASADAKVVNFASNLAAVLVFASSGYVVWEVALADGGRSARRCTDRRALCDARRRTNRSRLRACGIRCADREARLRSDRLIQRPTAAGTTFARRPHMALATFRALVVVVGVLSAGCESASEATPASPIDPLPSWRDSVAKQRILDFVGNVTRPGPNYLAPEKRVAVFDDDGTLWSEKPMPFATAYALDRVRNPVTKRRYTETIYKPMAEVLAFLRANGFTSYIVAGGDVDIVRPWAHDALGIPQRQIVRSRASVERAPVLAFGNSDADFPLLANATTGPGARLGVVIHHTDARREGAYDRDSKNVSLVHALAEAPARGWLVVDIARDWREVYPRRPWPEH